MITTEKKDRPRKRERERESMCLRDCVSERERKREGGGRERVCHPPT
jgi:hypothetical protein